MAFHDVINRVLALEGGYVNRPDDPGGETQWGISKRSYPDLDIQTLTREDAVAIYKTDFWDRVHGDELPLIVAFQALDFAVNSGIETAIRKLQVAAGVADDGHFGPATKAAITAMQPTALVLRFLAERLDFMRRLKGWPTFGAGWSGRIANDLRYAAEDLL